MKVTLSICGEPWKFRYSRRQKEPGWCYRQPKREIVVRQGMTEEETLDATIHELMHAIDWEHGGVLDEEFIERVGTVVARALIELGWTMPEHS